MKAKNISNENLEVFLKKNTQLEELDLSLCRQLNKIATSSIANYCKNLKNLSFYGCIFMKDELLIPILQVYIKNYIN